MRAPGVGQPPPRAGAPTSIGSTDAHRHTTVRQGSLAEFVIFVDAWPMESTYGLLHHVAKITEGLTSERLRCPRRR